MRQFAAIAWLAVIGLVVVYSVASTPVRAYQAAAELIIAVVVIGFAALACIGVFRWFSRS